MTSSIPTNRLSTFKRSVQLNRSNRKCFLVAALVASCSCEDSRNSLPFVEPFGSADSFSCPYSSNDCQNFLQKAMDRCDDKSDEDLAKCFGLKTVVKLETCDEFSSESFRNKVDRFIDSRVTGMTKEEFITTALDKDWLNRQEFEVGYKALWDSYYSDIEIFANSLRARFSLDRVGSGSVDKPYPRQLVDDFFKHRADRFVEDFLSVCASTSAPDDFAAMYLGIVKQGLKFEQDNIHKVTDVSFDGESASDFSLLDGF